MALADPTVRSQELGDELRKLREQAGHSLTSAGQRIDASASKVCRIENGHITAAPEDVAALLVVYNVTGPHRRELLDLAREAEKRGWWQRFAFEHQRVRRTIFNQECQASTIINFEATVIPGLLQTREYMRAAIGSGGLVDEVEIERRIDFRKERQALLTRRNPPHLLAIIDEFALHRKLGGRDAFQRQLVHLVHSSARDNITILVVPNDGHAHPGITGGFLLLRKAGRAALACTENIASCLYFEEQVEVEQYTSAVQRLSEHALDQQQSIELIATLAHTNDEAGYPWTEFGAAAATAPTNTSAWKSPETPAPRQSAIPRTRTGPS